MDTISTLSPWPMPQTTLWLIIALSIPACAADKNGERTPADQPTDVAPDATADVAKKDVDPPPDDTFSGECRTARDCAPSEAGPNQQTACSTDNQCVYICKEGYQDSDHDGECKPTCAEADLNCPSDTCVIAAGSPACKCPTGTSYNAQSGQCDLDKLVTMSEFRVSSQSGTTGEFTNIDQQAGEVVFQPGSTQNNSMVAQSYRLGSYDQPGPLKLELTYSLINCDPLCRFMDNVAKVNFNGIEHVLEGDPDSMGVQSKTLSTCVGTSAYGANGVYLSVRPGTNSQATDSVQFAPTFVFEDISLKKPSDGECPPHGKIRNGDFKHPIDDAWRLNSPGPDSKTQVVEREGDSMLELGGTYCTGASASQRVSIPDNRQTALTLDADVSNTTSLAASFRETAPSKIFGKPTGLYTRHWCLPDRSLGAVRTLRFAPLVGTGLCDESIPSAFVDDVKFTRREGCE